VLKKLRTSKCCPCDGPRPDLVNLLPEDLAAGNLIKLDKSTNAVILTGTRIAGSLRAFIRDMVSR
jgi:hypothetical protein